MLKSAFLLQNGTGTFPSMKASNAAQSHAICTKPDKT